MTKFVVEGNHLDGAAVVRNVPVLVGGVDGSSNVQTLKLGTDGSLAVTQTAQAAATATLANVNGSATSVTLIASNANRQGATIVNDSVDILYVKFGSAATATSYSYYLQGTVNGVPSTLEVPFGYTGIITGIWANATGAARTTEYTA